jgi:hypothetical protein
MGEEKGGKGARRSLSASREKLKKTKKMASQQPKDPKNLCPEEENGKPGSATTGIAHEGMKLEDNTSSFDEGNATMVCFFSVTKCCQFVSSSVVHFNDISSALSLFCTTCAAFLTATKTEGERLCRRHVSL